MESTTSVQIGRKSFIQAFVILLGLMLVAGILGRTAPPGRYDRMLQDGREVILPQSYERMAQSDYPFWRWFSAPIEVLWGPDGLTIIVIIVFLLMVGGAFSVLDRSGILRSAIGRVIERFGGRRYLLLLVISFVFMLQGAFFGIFEEVVPLVPLMVALASMLGWDPLIGLGMSILATNIGFSAAITNPFTIGVAQRIAGLPLFSGAWFRIPIFLVMYGILALFLVRYARRVDRINARGNNPESELPAGAEDADSQAMTVQGGDPRYLRRALLWFLGCFLVILAVLVATPFIAAVSAVALPLVGLLFLIGGVGAGLLAGTEIDKVLRFLGEGVVGIAPGIPLILMAASVKHIIVQAGVMDTILHSAAQSFSRTNSFAAVLMVYGLALFVEFFIGSASAKAFLIMPVVLPLADLVGITRQVTVTAYCFGDGFSNMAYPTNPVLLICLGLTAVSYSRWIKWTLKLWIGVLVITVAFLGLGVAINYGPF
ncbi:MAG: YfcC family protein [Chloroflexi bacterium]|nr:YfcC family protein [Chloroflexota bacterium]